MICPYCHNEHPDTAQFCPITGGKLSQAGYCPSCGNKVETDWRICGYCGQPLSGQVVPGAAPGYYPGYATPRRRGGWGCLAGGLIWLAVLVVVLLVVDSFTLHGVSRLLGDYDGAAANLPAESVMFVSVNFLNATPQKLEPVTEPFSRVTYQPGAPHRALVLTAPTQQGGEIDPFNMLLQEIEDDMALEIPDDLTSWAGQFGGVAMVLDADESDPYADPDIVIAIEARSPGKADSFLRSWVDRVSDQNNTQYTTDNYRGVTIYVPDGSFRLTFARSGWAVLAANDGDALRAAIDSQMQGDTLMKDKTFKNLMRQAPAGKTAAVFLRGEQLAELFRFEAQELEQVSTLLSLDAFNQNTLLALSIADEGLQVDILSAYSQGGPSSEMAEILDSLRQFSPKSAEYFPQDTVFLYAAPRLDLSLNRFVDVIAQWDGDSREGFYRQMQAGLGFRPDRDLFDYLNQDWGLGVSFNNQAGIELERNLYIEWLLLSSMEGQDSAGEAAEKVAWLAEAAGASIRQKESSGQAYYQVNLPFEDVALSYGFNRQVMLFTLGGDMSRVQALLNQEQTLARSPHYRETWGAFPRSMKPMLYIDLDGAAKSLGSQAAGVLNSYKYLQPVQRIAAAIKVDEDYQTHLRLVAFLEQP